MVSHEGRVDEEVDEGPLTVYTLGKDMPVRLIGALGGE